MLDENVKASNTRQPTPPQVEDRCQTSVGCQAQTSRKSLFERRIFQSVGETFGKCKRRSRHSFSMLERLEGKKKALEKKFRDGKLRRTNANHQQFRAQLKGNKGVTLEPTGTSYQPMLKELNIVREIRDRRLTNEQRMAHFGKDSSFFLTQNTTASSSNGRNSNNTKSTSEVQKERTLESGWRTKLSADEAIVTSIMMELDSDKLQSMKQDFLRLGNTLSLYDFVAMMMNYLGLNGEQEDREEDNHSFQQDRLLKVAQIVELFKQIDINGDGSLEWQEFTSYIINASKVRDSVSRVDNIKKYNIVPGLVCKHQQARSKTYSNLLYIDRLDHLIATESNSGTLLVFHAKSGAKLYESSCPSSIISVEYIDNGKYSYVVTSASDAVLSFWDTPTYRVRQRLPTKSAQYHLCWEKCVGENGILFSTSIETGEVLCWDAISLRLIQTLSLHTSTVTSVVALEQFSMFATGSLDGTIVLWDSNCFKKTRCLDGQGGVLCLAYSSTARFLVSAGFSREISVWNPYIGNLICVLKGHTAQIFKLIDVKGAPQLLSCDTNGMLKVWDMRSLSCCQSQKLSKEEVPTYILKPTTLGGPRGAKGGVAPKGKQQQLVSSKQMEIDRMVDSRKSYNTTLRVEQPVNSVVPESCQALAYNAHRKRIAIATGKSVAFLDYAKPPEAHLTDSFTTLDFCVNEASLTVLTIAGTRAKLWDVESGTLLRIFRNLGTSYVTALALDGGSRRALLGTAEGTLMMINATTGAVLYQHETSCKSEVKRIQYCATSRLFLVCYETGDVMLVNTNASVGFTVIKTVGVARNITWYKCNSPGEVLHVPDDVTQRPVVNIPVKRGSQHQKCFQVKGKNSSMKKKAPQLKGKNNSMKLKSPQVKGNNSMQQKSPQVEGNSSPKGISSFPHQKTPVAVTPLAEECRIAAVACDSAFDVAAAGGSDGSVCFWKASTGKVAMMGKHPGTAAVTDICFLTPYPLVASSDSQGRVVLWTTAPVTSRWYCVGVAHSKRRASEGEEQDMYISAMTWDPIHEALMTGDEEGYLERWCLGPTIKSLNLKCSESKWWEYGDRVVMSDSLQEYVSSLAKPDESENGSGFAFAVKSLFDSTKSREESVEETLSQRDKQAKTGKYEANGTEPNWKRRSTIVRQLINTLRLPKTLDFGSTTENTCWKAHDGEIISCRFIPNLNAFLTASTDKMVRAWSAVDGAYLGTLLQGRQLQATFASDDWKVPLGGIHQQQQRLNEAMKVLKEVESLKQAAGNRIIASEATASEYSNDSSSFEVHQQNGITEHEIRDIALLKTMSSSLETNKLEHYAYTGIRTDGSSLLHDLRNLSNPFNKSLHSSMVSNILTNSVSTVGGFVDASQTVSSSKKEASVLSNFSLQPGTSQHRATKFLKDEPSTSPTPRKKIDSIISPRKPGQQAYPASLVEAAERLAKALS